MVLADRKVLLLAADEFEDMELLYPLYRLREENVAVTVAGLDDQPVTGKKGHGPVAVDTTVDQVAAAEARAYLRHPVLGPRLAECARILAGARDGDAEQIFGGLDAQKLRSSMTLFLRADPAEPLFSQVLGKYFGGLPDPATDRLLRTPAPVKDGAVEQPAVKAGRNRGPRPGC
jgi:uncharacterized protein (DUF1810 family)